MNDETIASVSASGFELAADTEAGADMVAAATRLAVEFADGALVHDRDGTFAVEHLEKLRAERFLVAPVPTELGGGGVSSIHDVLVASSRLARGDPSTAIGVNMHFAGLVNMVRSWRIFVARGQTETATALANSMRRVVADDGAVCVTAYVDRRSMR